MYGLLTVALMLQPENVNTADITHDKTKIFNLAFIGISFTKIKPADTVFCRLIGSFLGSFDIYCHIQTSVRHRLMDDRTFAVIIKSVFISVRIFYEK